MGNNFLLKCHSPGKPCHNILDSCRRDLLINRFTSAPINITVYCSIKSSLKRSTEARRLIPGHKVYINMQKQLLFELMYHKALEYQKAIQSEMSHNGLNSFLLFVQVERVSATSCIKKKNKTAHTHTKTCWFCFCRVNICVLNKLQVDAMTSGAKNKFRQ